MRRIQGHGSMSSDICTLRLSRMSPGSVDVADLPFFLKWLTSFRLNTYKRSLF